MRWFCKLNPAHLARSKKREGRWRNEKPYGKYLMNTVYSKRMKFFCAYGKKNLKIFLRTNKPSDTEFINSFFAPDVCACFDKRDI